MEIIRKAFCMIGILSILLFSNSCTAPSSEPHQDETFDEVTEETTVALAEKDTDNENDAAGDLTLQAPEFRMTADVTTLAVDAVGIQTTLTGREPGEIIHWADQWCLYRLEGNEKTKIGSISQEAGIEMEAANADSYATVTFTILFSDLTSGRYMTLPAGEYELVYMFTYDEPSSESIRFTIVE